MTQVGSLTSTSPLTDAASKGGVHVLASAAAHLPHLQNSVSLPTSLHASASSSASSSSLSLSGAASLLVKVVSRVQTPVQQPSNTVQELQDANWKQLPPRKRHSRDLMQSEYFIQQRMVRQERQSDSTESVDEERLSTLPGVKQSTNSSLLSVRQTAAATRERRQKKTNLSTPETNNHAVNATSSLPIIAATSRKRRTSPSSETIPPPTLSNTETELYCICRQPYDASQFMIGCDGCDNWFHVTCLGMREKEARKLKHWFCEQCAGQGKSVKKSKSMNETNQESVNNQHEVNQEVTNNVQQQHEAIVTAVKAEETVIESFEPTPIASAALPEIFPPAPPTPPPVDPNTLSPKRRGLYHEQRIDQLRTALRALDRYTILVMKRRICCYSRPLLDAIRTGRLTDVDKNLLQSYETTNTSEALHSDNTNHAQVRWCTTEKNKCTAHGAWSMIHRTSLEKELQVQLKGLTKWREEMRRKIK